MKQYQRLEAKLDYYFWTALNANNQINNSRRISLKQLMLFRVFSSLYIFTMLNIYFATMVENNGEYFQYLTVQGAFFTQFYFALSAIENIGFMLNNNKQFFYDSLWKTAHLFYEIAFSYSFSIIIVFWCQYLVSNIDIRINFFLNLNNHGIFFSLLYLDTFFNQIELYRRHFKILLFYGLVYCIVNLAYSLIYYPIYFAIDWVSLTSYGVLLCGIVCVMILFFLGSSCLNQDKKRQLSQVYAQNSPMKTPATQSTEPLELLVRQQNKKQSINLNEKEVRSESDGLNYITDRQILETQTDMPEDKLK